MALQIFSFKVSICPWLVGVTLIFDGTPQIIVQRCQTAALVTMRLQTQGEKIEYSFGFMARSAVLLKPHVANILLFNFSEQKFDPDNDRH